MTSDFTTAARDSSRQWRHRDAAVRQGCCRHSECWRSDRRWVWRSWCPADRTRTAAEHTSCWCQSRDESPASLNCCRLARESRLSNLGRRASVHTTNKNFTVSPAVGAYNSDHETWTNACLNASSHWPDSEYFEFLARWTYHSESKYYTYFCAQNFYDD